MVLLQANIDDLSSEVMGYAFDQLFEAGALDVFVQPLLMKKNRMGQLLSVLCKSDLEETLVKLLFTETSTIGIRRQVMERHVLNRQIETRDTEWGPIRFKEVSYRGQVCGCYPEFEDLKRLSIEKGIPVKELVHVKPLNGGSGVK